MAVEKDDNDKQGEGGKPENDHPEQSRSFLCPFCHLLLATVVVEVFHLEGRLGISLMIGSLFLFGIEIYVL